MTEQEYLLLVEPPSAGAWNMAVDEALLSMAAEEGQMALRFYQWCEPTLSLGYFQRQRDRAQHPSSLNCPLVRRASGGGAIVHDRELTYSLSLPATQPLAERADRLYVAVHTTLIELLGELGAVAQLSGPSEPPPTEPFLCFQRKSAADVVIQSPRGGAVKIAGSAQRRRRGAILQHGSVLLRRSSRAPELPGIMDIVDVDWSFGDFVARWESRLGALLRARSRPTSLPDRLEVAIRDLRKKHLSPDWLARR
jgi:lipoate-protein ligase A